MRWRLGASPGGRCGQRSGTGISRRCAGSRAHVATSNVPEAAVPGGHAAHAPSIAHAAWTQVTLQYRHA